MLYPNELRAQKSNNYPTTRAESCTSPCYQFYSATGTVSKCLPCHTSSVLHQASAISLNELRAQKSNNYPTTRAESCTRPLLSVVGLVFQKGRGKRVTNTYNKFRSDLKNLVGVERFELPTHCSQSSCATRLRYTPKSAY
jgi:hypothetical protein